nr:hypothetical protein [Oscillospiraceae bacterium]
MGNIMTRAAISKIMADEGATPEQRTEQIMALYGRALDDGYVSKSAAAQAQETALTAARAEWEKGVVKPDPKQSDEYRALQGEFDAYRTMQQARTSEEYAGVKPKFFEAVYGMIQRGDGAKPVKDQLAEIRGQYEEYFTAPPANQQPKPTFGAPTQGSMPKGEEGAVAAFSNAWGFGPKKG